MGIEKDPRRVFAEALAMYDLQPDLRTQELIDAAGALLGTGFETNNVLALASLPTMRTHNAFVLAERVSLAREDLGMPAIGREGAQIRVAQAMARRWLAGELTDRELADWAHRTLTHFCADEVGDLVFHADELDTLVYTNTSEEAAHQTLVTIVATLLAIPDPWRAAEGEPDAETAG